MVLDSCTVYKVSSLRTVNYLPAKDKELMKSWRVPHWMGRGMLRDGAGVLYHL